MQLAAVDDDGLAGFALGRVLRGEFGRARPALRLEAIAVRPDAKGAGLGARLFAALRDWARAHDIAEVRTQSPWNRHAMLRWLDEVGFVLAPASVVDRAVGPREPDPGDGDDGGAAREID